MSTPLPASAEVREPPAGVSVDVQSECCRLTSSFSQRQINQQHFNLMFFLFKYLHISLISPEPAIFPVVTVYKHLPDLLTCQQGVNTVITDLCSCASFLSTSASFSSPHQLSCFRDELLFFLYLYQRRYDASHIMITIPPPTQRAPINTVRCVHFYLNSKIQMQVFRNNEA